MTELRKTAEVVIIGGGVIGLSVARALAHSGLRDVLLIERSSLGAESSSAAAGMLAPQAEAESADEFFYFCRESRDMYPNFAAELYAETGIDIELQTQGTIYLAFNEYDLNELEKRYQWQSKAGLEVEILSGQEVKFLEPSVSDTVRAALSLPLDTQVENRRLISALASSNEKLGVCLLTGTTVSSLKVDRGRIDGVETSSGFIATEKVVIAGGAWTSLLEVSDNVSHKSLPPMRIEPVRGQMVCFESNPQILEHVIYSPRGYVVPRRDGRLLAGSTTERVGFDKRVTAAGVQSILSSALEITPEIGRLPLIASWAGLRPRAADGLPVLGPCDEIEGVFYATGHYRNGILLAPITAKLIAEAIVNKVVPKPLNLFSPNRFRMAFAN